MPKMEYDDVLAHYGVLGMKWGVRKRDPLTPAQAAARKKKIKTIGIVAASVGAAAAIAAGAYFVNKKMGAKLDTKLVDIPAPSDKVKDAVKAVMVEPTELVHATRGRDAGFQFPGKGGLEDPLLEYDKAFADAISKGGGPSDGDFHRYGFNSEKIAIAFADPEGRKDFAGRPIHHEVVIPAEMSDGIENLEQAIDLVWPKIKDDYAVFYNKPKYS